MNAIKLQSKSKGILCALMVIVSLTLSAQNGLSNMSFENWSSTIIGNAPTGWLGSNLNLETSVAQNGSKYVRVFNTNNTQGFLMLGMINSLSSIKGGAPYTAIPGSLSGYYKTLGLAVNDVVGITAYTSSSGTLTYIGNYTMTSNVNSWTPFSLSFTSFNSGPNDSIFIIATTANNFGQGTNSSGAILDLDNLSLLSSTGTTGIENRSQSSSFMMYPNPASDELFIVSAENGSVEITGLDGSSIDQAQINPGKTKIDTKGYGAGIYFYSVFNEEKKVVRSNRFIIVR